MTKKEFNYLVKSPKTHIKKIEMDQIDVLKKQFPYCETIHNLSLLKAKALDDINFTNILSITSIYSSNRRNLFYLTNPPKNKKQKITDADNSLASKETSHLFEEWLKDPLLIPQKKTTKKMIRRNVDHSIQDNDYLTTETLAKIYLDQEHYERAIQAYEILCLKYPKKSSFFANQIENIKNRIK